MISIPNQAFNLSDAFQKCTVVRDIVKVLLVQARDALHNSCLALPEAGRQSSKRGLLGEGGGRQRGRQGSALPNKTAGPQYTSKEAEQVPWL